MRVLLADDHSIIRNALKFILQDLEAEVTFEEAREYPSLEDRLAAEGPPLDMVVMDLQMPGYEGLAQIRRIVERAAPTPIAVFSMMEAVEDMRAVLRQGVRAFIPKSTDEALIGTLLKLVAGGGTYVPAQVSGISDCRFPPPLKVVLATDIRTIGEDFDDNPRLSDLTRRQREVLALMSQGLSNLEIGNRLGLNLSTVKTHVTGILKALDAGNRTQAVLMARGLDHG
ncbi:response regulator [Rhodospirillum rubrum]|uniref:Two component transcriptional regulator, LuxR family n=1 Tax=Rhodospirillum rubrum (strain ATCC 11170 / ATH 1.1.1 / DSM 467 / LMG 4362 / NCIMB 8255 / S1) TaxID=269796 RepID=Q2RR45_RHORT|nr:response regulator transcription factor [Rhodospirillum rubrum]ABC23400.1 two component transcriptional regulator, LuxR family [Rhodospirillum rubrum ATCC 11170]AEO49136.1 two component LuxR family transcriptional regulator [Rhodospirillum rubrum F11]MBK5955050.1 DNA-binding response regulator [Rhodospirillum rubrum]QXG79372.1 response regulator transcription factor [Rhodospirillum rubrum]HAP99104.1 DNA-binding response regulator [Rhodospirillum rubrum]